MKTKTRFAWKQFLKNLAIIAIPVALQNMLTTTGSMIDTMMIAPLGETTVGAVGLCAQFSSLMFAGYWGFFGGGMLFFSQYWGAQDDDGIDHSYGLTLTCMMIVGLTFGAFAIFAPETVMKLYTDKESIQVIGAEYLRIIGFGYPVQVFSMAMSALLRSTERVRIPLFASIASVASNIFLNWVFIYGKFGLPEMGVRGAALATILSQAVSCAWVVRFLCSEKSTLRLRAKNLLPDMKLLLPCLALGLSPFLMQITENLVAVSFNVTLLRFAGDTAVGAVTVLTTTMSLCMQLLHGLTQGAQPIMSFNYGAGNGQRVRETFRILFISCLTGSMLVWAVCMLFPGTVAGMFTPDAELSSYTAWAMRIYMAASGIFGIQIACQQSFVALGQAKVAIFLALLRKVILLIPLILLLPRLGIFENAAFAVFLAEPVADTLAVCTTAAMFFTRFGKLTAGAENA